jgi:hypothetical protein
MSGAKSGVSCRNGQIPTQSYRRRKILLHADAGVQCEPQTSSMNDNLSLLEPFRRLLIGVPLSYVWRGHGSAIFLEFGKLSQTTRRNGERGEPRGEFGVMIQWSWRVEEERAIICGSWSEEQLWKPTFERLIGKTVVDVNLFARLPELTIVLTDNLHVSSFMTAEGEPEWTLFDRRASKTVTLSVQSGRLHVDANPEI